MTVDRVSTVPEDRTERARITCCRRFGSGIIVRRLRDGDVVSFFSRTPPVHQCPAIIRVEKTIRKRRARITSNDRGGVEVGRPESPDRRDARPFLLRPQKRTSRVHTCCAGFPKKFLTVSSSASKGSRLVGVTVLVRPVPFPSVVGRRSSPRDGSGLQSGIFSDVLVIVRLLFFLQKRWR